MQWAICRWYGHLDLFPTFTCNAKWLEIQRASNLIIGHKVKDRLDFISQVFKMKLDHLVSTLKRDRIFGVIVVGT